MTSVVMYTDGSACRRDDGTFLCGFSFVFVKDGEPVYGMAYPGVGTINQAEMCAVSKGIDFADSHNITVSEVYTDSTYVTNGIRSNLIKFDTGDWVNAHGEAVSNKDMWVSLCTQWKKLGDRAPEVIHVKGHTGLPFNELCDVLAKDAAISQKPVHVWYDYDFCAEHNLMLPRVVFSLPLAAVKTEPYVITQNTDNRVRSVVETLNTYTDDRSRACIIDYPTCTALISKSVSVWIASDEEGIRLDNRIRTITLPGGELPLYNYRSELGHPLEVLLNSSKVDWQGDAFKDVLKESIAHTRGRDIVLASYNYTGAKSRGLPGIYIMERGLEDNRMLALHRSERVTHGKHMVIPYGYLEALNNVLSDPTTVIGLITTGDRYTLVVTGNDVGMIIGSSSLPHSMDCQGLRLAVKESSDIKISFTNTYWAKMQSKNITDSAIPYSVLENLMSAPESYPKTEDVLVLLPEDSCGYNEVTEPDKNDIIEETEDTYPGSNRDDLIARIRELDGQIRSLEELRRDLFNQLVDAKFKYPEMTPQMIEDIEARVRADMKNKLTSLFI